LLIFLIHTCEPVFNLFLDGSVKIVDRAKNIFKIPLGEYIAPEKLEGTFLQSQYVAQVFT
jgi:long-subunit acyl-CoA synthetase (AMP-forming)